MLIIVVVAPNMSEPLGACTHHASKRLNPPGEDLFLYFMNNNYPVQLFCSFKI